MISNLLKYTFVLTSISPVFIVLAFVKFYNEKNYIEAVCWLSVFIFSVFSAYFIIRFSKRKLQKWTIRKISSLSPADKEIGTFLIAYVLPMINPMDIVMEILVIVILFFAVLSSSNYHFNPVLSLLFNYRYYEIEIEQRSGYRMKYLLITKRIIENPRSISQVSLITDYILIEVE